MQTQLAFFVSIAFSFIAWGITAARYIWPELRLRPRAEALRPLLILHSFRFIGLSMLVPGVVSPDAANLRAFCGLWGHHCGDTGVAFATVTPQRGRDCHCVDL